MKNFRREGGREGGRSQSCLQTRETRHREQRPGWRGGCGHSRNRHKLGRTKANGAARGQCRGRTHRPGKEATGFRDHCGPWRQEARSLRPEPGPRGRSVLPSASEQERSLPFTPLQAQGEMTPRTGRGEAEGDRTPLRQASN